MSRWRMPKDRDQQAVYYAEKVAFEGTLFAEPLHSDDFMRLADSLFTHDWWERYRIPVPTIEPTKRRDATSYLSIYHDRPEKDPIIRIAPTDINPWILAHEASHLAQYHFYRANSYGLIETHGREFRVTYLRVAEIVLGREAADTLRNKFSVFVPTRPEHAPGMPGSIMCVPKPRPEHDPNGTGLFPLWRLERQNNIMKQWNDRPVVSSVERVNGAIAL
jgi:hypothetical protein